MTAAEFLAPLEGVKGSSARCPAHEDKNASLSVTQESDRVLVHCHAGCTPEAVCKARGVKLSDLFSDHQNGNGKSEIVATYDYRNQKGKVIFQVARMAPKAFRQRRPANGGWIWNMDGIERVLFRLPEITRDIQRGLPIFICEGEKDVLRMVEEGFSATCNPGGALKWQNSYSEALRDADCIIIADKDEAGRKHAALVSERLENCAKRCRVIELPDTNGKPVKDAFDFFEAGGDVGTVQSLVDAAGRGSLPEIIDAADFIAAPLAQPSELIAGIIHKGSKLVLGGGSKSFKTWTLLDLALSVAHGKQWLGRDTSPGRVLYLNFEIQPWSWQGRVKAVASAKGIQIESGRLSIWNLRGKAANFDTLLPQVREAAKEDFALIVLDPIYKLYGGTDENKAGDVARLLNAIEDLAVSTSAAVAFGAHFSKGNQAGKESIDRISGSGVFARDPDSLLVFTRHESEDCFTIEPTLRNFAPVQPFAVRWQYPLMLPDDTLDPSKLKKTVGRNKEHTAERLLEVLGGQSLKSGEWQKQAKEDTGMSERTFYTLLGELQKSDSVIQSKINRCWARVSK